MRVQQFVVGTRVYELYPSRFILWFEHLREKINVSVEKTQDLRDCQGNTE
jgi:hypothetical protein